MARYVFDDVSSWIRAIKRWERRRRGSICSYDILWFVSKPCLCISFSLLLFLTILLETSLSFSTVTWLSSQVLDSIDTWTFHSFFLWLLHLFLNTFSQNSSKLALKSNRFLAEEAVNSIQRNRRKKIFQEMSRIPLHHWFIGWRNNWWSLRKGIKRVLGNVFLPGAQNLGVQ